MHILRALGADPMRVLELIAKDAPMAFRRAVTVAADEARSKKVTGDQLIRENYALHQNRVRAMRLCMALYGLSIPEAKEYVMQLVGDMSVPSVHSVHSE